MTTKLFKVVTNDNLRVRTSPLVLRENLVPNRYLVRDDILEVRADSSKEGSGWIWWEHAASPGFWTASQNSTGTVILMEEHKPDNIIVPTPETPTVVTSQIFEVQDYLNVRSAPKFGNNLTGERLKPGERLAFKNPTIADNYQWWELVDKPGKWASSGSLSGGAALMIPVKAQEPTTDNVYKMTVPWITQIQSGINFANDCGHTCALMVMRYMGIGWDKKVGDLYALSQFRHARGWTNQVQLRMIADAFGAKMTDFAKTQALSSDMDWLRETLRTKGPVILLVWYPSLGFSNTANGPFNHWVVITGYADDKFFMNDPLWTTENKGANRQVSAATLLKATQSTNASTHFMGLHPA